MLLKCANIFCIMLITLVALWGCQRTDILRSGTDTEVSFEADIQPILTAKCALSGCHVADGLKCTAIGNLDHSLNKECGTLQL